MSAVEDAAPAVAAVAAPSSKAKAPKAKKTKEPKAKAAKAPASHPVYSVMVAKAIAELKEKTGSSKAAILKYVLANYKVGENINKVNAQLRLSLKRGVASGNLKQVKGTGASGSFKLGQKRTAALAKDKTVKKAVKAKAAPAEKKAQSPKKAAAKPKAKISKKPATPKKTKSPKRAAVAKPKAKKAAAPKRAAAKAVKA